VGARCAEVFARLMAELAGVTVAPPLPNPPWRAGTTPIPGCGRRSAFPDIRDQSIVPVY